MASSPSARPLLVVDALLAGEPEHGRLGGAPCIGTGRTEAGYALVDLGPYGALVREGSGTVTGELYLLERTALVALDVHREVPRLFERLSIRLHDGTVADAYVLPVDQARGRRRIASGDWRKRFMSSVPRPPRAWSEWARKRQP